MKNPAKLLILFFLATFTATAQTWDWVKTHSSAISDEGESIGVDQWGNVYVKGISEAYAAGPNGGAYIYHLLFKYSPNGALLWMDTLTAKGHLAKTDNNGNTFIVGGNIITKYDSSGTQLWVKTIANRHFTQMALAPNGGIVVSGQIPQVACSSIIYMIDGNGNIMWNRSGDMPSCASPIVCDKFNNTYAFVYQSSTGGAYNYKLLKIDSIGNLTNILAMPQFTFGAWYYSLDVTDDQSILVSGTLSGGTNYTTTLVKYDQQGTTLWVNNIIGGGAQINHDTQNNIYLLTGFSGSLQYQSTTLTGSNCLVILKLNPNGNVIWSKQTIGNNNLVASSMAVSKNNVYLTGFIQGTHHFDNITATGDVSYQDMFLAKLSQPSVVTSLKEEKKSDEAFTLSPNPTSNLFKVECGELKSCNIKIQILNSLGQRVYTETKAHTNGNYSKIFDMGDMAKGIYFVEINTGDERTVKKVVLQ